MHDSKAENLQCLLLLFARWCGWGEAPPSPLDRLCKSVNTGLQKILLVSGIECLKAFTLEQNQEKMKVSLLIWLVF